MMIYQGLIVDQKYILMEEIGSGGFGRVFRALKVGRQNHESVAIKFLQTESQSPAEEEILRFYKEGFLMSRIQHSLIASVFDFGRTKDLLYIVMQYIEGENLRSFKDSEHFQNMSIHERLELIILICEALESVHKHDIIHLDIKPQNIIIAKEQKKWRPYLLDFGVSKLAKTLSSLVPQKHLAAGTLKYMAPEILMTPQHVSFQADIYSLGILMYELFFPQATLLIDATNNDTLLKSKRELYENFNPENKPVEQWSNLTRLIYKSIEWDPQKRYQTVFGILCDLKKIRRYQITQDTSLIQTPITLAGKDFNIGSVLRNSQIGLEKEKDTLRQFIKKAQNRSRVSWFAIKGESGSGKSTFLNLTAQMLQDLNMHFLRVDFSEIGQKEPFSHLTSAINEYLIYLSQIYKEDYYAFLAQLAQNLEELTPGLSEYITSLRLFKKNKTAAPQQTIFDENQSFLVLLKILAEKSNGLFFLFDDLHLADKATLNFLYFLSSNLNQTAHFSFVFTYNESLNWHQDPLWMLLNTVSQIHRRFEQITLSPFNEKEIGKYLETLGMKQPSEALLKDIQERTKGLPGTLNEFVRFAFEEDIFFPVFEASSHLSSGPLIKDIAIDWDQFKARIHEHARFLSIDSLIESLNNCQPNEMRILETLALSPYPTPSKRLEHLFALDSESLKELLNQLQNRGLIIQEQGLDDYFISFTHKNLARRALNHIPIEKIKNRHLQVAQQILKQNVISEQDWLHAARHAELSGFQTAPQESFRILIETCRILLNNRKFIDGAYYLKILEKLFSSYQEEKKLYYKDFCLLKHQHAMGMGHYSNALKWAYETAGSLEKADERLEYLKYTTGLALKLSYHDLLQSRCHEFLKKYTPPLKKWEAWLYAYIIQRIIQNPKMAFIITRWPHSKKTAPDLLTLLQYYIWSTFLTSHNLHNALILCLKYPLIQPLKKTTKLDRMSQKLSLIFHYLFSSETRGKPPSSLFFPIWFNYENPKESNLYEALSLKMQQSDKVGWFQAEYRTLESWLRLQRGIDRRDQPQNRTSHINWKAHVYPNNSKDSTHTSEFFLYHKLNLDNIDDFYPKLQRMIDIFEGHVYGHLNRSRKSYTRLIPSERSPLEQSLSKMMQAFLLSQDSYRYSESLKVMKQSLTFLTYQNLRTLPVWVLDFYTILLIYTIIQIQKKGDYKFNQPLTEKFSLFNPSMKNYFLSFLSILENNWSSEPFVATSIFYFFCHYIKNDKHPMFHTFYQQAKKQQKWLDLFVLYWLKGESQQNQQKNDSLLMAYQCLKQLNWRSLQIALKKYLGHPRPVQVSLEVYIQMRLSNWLKKQFKGEEDIQELEKNLRSLLPSYLIILIQKINQQWTFIHDVPLEHQKQATELLKQVPTHISHQDINIIQIAPQSSPISSEETCLVSPQSTPQNWLTVSLKNLSRETAIIIGPIQPEVFWGSLEDLYLNILLQSLKYLKDLNRPYNLIQEQMSMEERDPPSSVYWEKNMTIPNPMTSPKLECMAWTIQGSTDLIMLSVVGNSEVNRESWQNGLSRYCQIGRILSEVMGKSLKYISSHPDQIKRLLQTIVSLIEVHKDWFQKHQVRSILRHFQTQTGKVYDVNINQFPEFHFGEYRLQEEENWLHEGWEFIKYFNVFFTIRNIIGKNIWIQVVPEDDETWVKLLQSFDDPKIWSMHDANLVYNFLSKKSSKATGAEEHHVPSHLEFMAVTFEKRTSS